MRELRPGPWELEMRLCRSLGEKAWIREEAISPLTPTAKVSTGEVGASGLWHRKEARK